MLNVAIVGFGGIAQAAHMPAYRHLQGKGKIRLLAVCDIDPNRFTQKMEINIGGGEENAAAEVRRYTNLETMLANETPELVDICLPTPFHAPVASDLLRRGYHVLSEKPMARTYVDCLEMIRAARESDRRLMIGQCLRFFPDYSFLKNAVDSGSFGKPLAAAFRRQSAPPKWAWENWYMNPELSGGCLMDMHIHDLDMIRYLFGEPQTVSCRSQDIDSRFDVVYSQLDYPELPVTAIGDWSQTGTNFAADFRVAFETATLIGENGGVMVYPRSGEPYRAELNGPDGYTGEIEFFVDTIASQEKNIKNPPESAATTIRLIETLRESALAGGERIPFKPEKI
ncbi:MAG: Gfo/Idh/MocA family oxidoreductase [Clostridiales bacterium]|nr:Gfo/Idh/MocA family oxidoreductase [Clostridiales bacterium]